MSEDKVDEPFDWQVLAAGFKIPGAMKKFDEEINPLDVGLIHGFSGIHEVYKGMLSFYRTIGTDDSDMLDPPAFKSWLKDETDIMDALGGPTGVDTLLTKFDGMELSNMDSIIKMVEHRGKKRRQLDKLQQMKEIINNKGQATQEDAEQLSKLAEQIKELDKDLDYDPLASVRTAKDVSDSIDDLWELPPFLPTQFPTLNKAIGYDADKGGYMRGSVNCIAAGSGKGKSTLARTLCNYWLDQGETILFINFEEPQQHWERTMMTQVVKRNIYAEANNLSSAEKKGLTVQFREKLAEWGNRFMVRHDPETQFFEDLERWLRDILGRGARQPTVVVIDTIQSMFMKSGGKARWGEYEQMMVRLEKLAKDMDAVFIITAQQNSDAIKSGRDSLNQGDMGGSLAIIQKSTIAFFLTSMRDLSGDATINPLLMECQIVKNRITGTLYTSAPPMMVYNDTIKSYIPYKMVIEKNDDDYDDEESSDIY